jgi:hypothetical protein
LSQDKGTASQMLAQITKAPGVKPVELRATGLDEFLKGKGNDPVTKQEIQDFLTSNRVQVDEVVLGRGLSMSPEAKRLMEDAEKRMMKADQVMAPFFEQQEAGSLLQGQEPYSTFYRIRGPLSRKIVGGDQKALAELDALNLPPDIRQAVLDFGAAKLDYQKHSKPARFEQKPKFDGYNIPGGTNAREIYLTLPGVKEGAISKAETARLDELAQKRVWRISPIGSSLDGLSPAEQSEYFSLIDKREKAGAAFTAPGAHAVSPEADKNRLAHIFLDERKDAKGDRVLFVQEMQSDWAQTGRNKGFFDFGQKAELPEGTKIFEPGAFGLPLGPLPLPGQTDQVFTVQIPRSVFGRSLFYGTTREEALANAQSFVAKPSLSAIPSAPFVTNTEDWLNLSLKRVIKEAVDNDIDTVAFIKGEQAADKYDLSKQIDEINVVGRTDVLTGEQTKSVALDTTRGQSLRFGINKEGIVDNVDDSSMSNFIGKGLDEVIGKDLAKKIMDGGSQTISGEGLKVGGEGMKGFYDNILPKTAEKLLKKLGGGKVETVKISEGDQYLGFKITPEMREMVKTQGLPKFAAGGEVTDFIKRAT